MFLIEFKTLITKITNSTSNTSVLVYKIFNGFILFLGVESAHSGEALLPDVGYHGGGGGRVTPKNKKTRGRENTPLIRGSGNRNRSEYEDLDDEMFNNWASKDSKFYIKSPQRFPFNVCFHKSYLNEEEIRFVR